MNDHTARPPAINKTRLRRDFCAWLLLLGLLATIGVLAGACGGGSKDQGVASLGGPITTVAPAGSSGSGSSGDGRMLEQLQFARCMRSHGVPNFPDPKPNEGELQNIASAHLDTRSAAYQAAVQACKKYTPAGSMTPAQNAAELAKELEFSQCMRSHGVPNFPDPVTGPDGAPAINLGPEHIDPRTPTYQAANRTCQTLVSGSK